MPLVNLTGIKLRPDLPYMVESEKSLFNLQKKKGGLSIFRISKCQAKGCCEYVPKHKKYCSKDCYVKTEIEPLGREIEDDE